MSSQGLTWKTLHLDTSKISASLNIPQNRNRDLLKKSGEKLSGVCLWVRLHVALFVAFDEKDLAYLQIDKMESITDCIFKSYKAIQEKQRRSYRFSFFRFRRMGIFINYNRNTSFLDNILKSKKKKNYNAVLIIRYKYDFNDTAVYWYCMYYLF